MNEQELRGLVVAFTNRAATHREAARTTRLEEAQFVNDGWASGYEAAAAELVDLLDGPEAVRAFWAQVHGGPGRSIEEVRAVRVRHLSEKDPHAQGAA